MALFKDLSKAVQIQYEKALEAGDLVFTESEVVTVPEAGIQFEVRFAPALAKKPVKSAGAGAASDKAVDPFTPPYVPNLYVTESKKDELEDGDYEEHVILLNKFCVVPRHFLLVTKDFSPQNSFLTPSDIYATFSALASIARNRREPEHLAFFNCGDQSGASQPHKHIQFVPLPDERSPLAEMIAEHAPSKEGEVFSLPALPFANFACTLPPKLSSRPTSEVKSALMRCYLPLIDAMVDNLRRLAESAAPDAPPPPKLSQLSYNLIMTCEYMQVVPRTKERFAAPAQEGGVERVDISVNSLGFAGMLLVKTQEELEAVKGLGVLEVLKGVAFPLLPADDEALGNEAYD